MINQKTIDNLVKLRNYPHGSEFMALLVSVLMDIVKHIVFREKQALEAEEALVEQLSAETPILPRVLTNDNPTNI